MTPDSRRQAFAILAVTIAWQIYVVVSTSFHAAAFRQLFTGLGAEVPQITRLFFATYRWWFICPVIFAALLADIARRRTSPVWYLPLLTGCSLAAGFILQAFATEACFIPLFSLIKQIG